MADVQFIDAVGVGQVWSQTVRKVNLAQVVWVRLQEGHYLIQTTIANDNVGPNQFTVATNSQSARVLERYFA